jgi:hypothetical protein
MPYTPDNGQQFPNFLLSGLDIEDYGRLVPHLHSVKLNLGDVIQQESRDWGFAYFPTTSVISLMCDMEDGATVEVALTGNDGVVGTSLFLEAIPPRVAPLSGLPVTPCVWRQDS